MQASAGESTDEVKAKRLIDGFYALTRKAVDIWGGPLSLAAHWGCALSNISVRLARKESKGVMNYAFVDFLAIATTKPEAAEQFLFGLCDLFGYERPKRKRTKTEHEKFEALTKALRSCGPLGEAAIARAAADLGADVSEFEP